MLWGGLQPIPRQVAIDSITLLGMVWCTWNMVTARSAEQSARRSIHDGTKILVATCFWIVATSGTTNRWTLTIPLIPFTLIHLVHRLTRTHHVPPTASTQSHRRSSGCLHWLLIALAALCIITGALLSVLFPALELPMVDGPYHVGVVDFYIPLDTMTHAIPMGPSEIEADTTDTCSTEESQPSSSSCSSTSRKQVYLPARLLYPTVQRGGRWDHGVPYLNPTTVIEFCRHSMLYAAPPPLKRFGWILHTWRLTKLALVRLAPILVDARHGSTMPLVVYSHGFGGTLDLYSYQAMMLASHGSMVLTLTHTDGTAPVVPQPDNNDALKHNGYIMSLHLQGKTVDYVHSRRLQTDHRARELIYATEFIHQLVDGSQSHPDDTHSFLHSSHNELRALLADVRFNHTTLMGHSHGGATVLSAARGRRDLVDAVVAHEPVIDWAPDICRRAIFPSNRLIGLSVEYNGGTGNFDNSSPLPDERNGSLHDLDILILNSNQWVDKGWGSIDLIEAMFQHGRFGKPNGPSRHIVVANSTHNEFSDTSMLTPLWLARPTALAGPRNPIDTAAEIAAHTRLFLEEARR